MPNRPDPHVDLRGLAAIARAVADGTEVDWSAELERAADRAGAVRQLQVLATIQHAAGSASTVGAHARWGPLLVFERIGQGSFGTVYRARDRRLARDVALKLIPSGESTSAGDVIEEGRLLAKVRHPNVLTVFGAEEIDGQIGIWTELVNGRTVADIVRRDGPLPWPRAARITADVCAAVAAVHSGGLIHRDIKAQNVMLASDSRVVLMDFGAGLDVAQSAEYLIGQTPGTPMYTAPEVWAGAPASAQSDVYAIGVLFFFLLTGRFPVEARTAAELESLVRAGRRPVWDSVRTRLPDNCAEIIDRALAVAPRNRYQTAGALEADLVDTVNGRGSSGTHRRMTAGLHAALLVSAAALLFTVLPHGSSHASSEPTSTKLTFLSNALSMPSPDGRFFPFERGGRLSEWLVASGRTETLPWRPATPGWIVAAVPSHDGRRIAVMRQTADEVYELDVVRRDEERASVVSPSTDANQMLPIQWSADDRQLLAWIVRKNRRPLLALLDPSTAATRILREFAVKPYGASLSPDRRFIAFDQPAGSDQGTRDVFVAPVDGGPAVAIAAHPADDTRPFWTSDGRGLVFTSARSGSTAEWFVRIESGAAIDEPRLIARLPPGSAPLSLADDGSLFYFVRTNDIDVYTVPIDLPQRKQSGPAARVDPAITGGRSLPAWSADSRYLSYLSTNAAGQDVFNVLEWSSRAVRSVPLPLTRHWDQVKWAPDGSCVMFAGIDVQNRRGFFCMDAHTGGAHPLWLLPGPGDERLPPFDFFGRDAFIYFDTQRGLVVRERASGAERLLIALDEAIRPTGSFRVSPDGRSIAFNALLGHGPRQRPALAVKPLDGNARILVEAPPGQSTLLQAWSPDSKSLLFTRFTPGPDPSRITYRLETLDVASRVERNVDVSVPAFTSGHELAVRPDGTVIAYAHFTNVALVELWRMQHLLPER